MQFIIFAIQKWGIFLVRPAIWRDLTSIFIILRCSSIRTRTHDETYW